MMLSVQYVGETLLPGQIGHFCLTFGFVAVLFAVFAFYKHTNTDDISWQRFGKVAFVLHGISVFTLVGTIFYTMVNRLYEYQYAFDHVSNDLPMRYAFSAFWEGQEGSFLLWMMWHIVLASIIIFGKKSIWTSPVAAIILAVQAFTHSMILGIYVPIGEGFRWGINPTLLLRDGMDIPLFNNAQYLSMIKDGNGLNELLQNYWMTIHPPVTFLGFASTTVPFAFAIAGWWKKDYKGWLRPVTTWGIFSAAILGTGILMGGAWAYEALSFGGYWAWDPVENMSLVPWMILVAGVHTNLIANASGYSIKSTYIFYVLSFLMIVYSTFLTRSGILGDTSAHAFTEMGLEWQLVGYIGFFAIGSVILYFARAKNVPTKTKEESLYSKEFWMFIGAIVLFFGSMLIAISSSLPVYNAIMEYFDPLYIGKVIEEPIPHYNKYQLWVAIFISLLGGFSVYTRFRQSGWNREFKKSLFLIQGSSLLAAGILTYLMTFWIDYYETRYAILTFCLLYGMVSSLWYLIRKAGQKTKMAAASLSHLGFALMILGTVTSGLNTKVISSNPFAMRGLLADESLAKVITLIKEVPMFVNDYWITYEQDTVVGRYRYFDVRFDRIDEHQEIVETFRVTPNVQYNKEFTKIAASNPATKHYWNKDIFTNIASLPRSQQDIELAKEVEDSLDYNTYRGFVGDTLITKQHFAIIREVTYEPSIKDVPEDSLTLSLGVELEFGAMDDDKTYILTPAMGLKENNIFEYHAVEDKLGVKVKLDESVFRNEFSTEDALTYETFKVKEGDEFFYDGYLVKVVNLGRNFDEGAYTQKEGDIPVGAKLDITQEDRKFTLNPIYFIRNNRPLNIKDYDAQSGLHVRFISIDPKDGTLEFALAKDLRKDTELIFSIAEDVPRQDLIVLEAKVFPGINLFWGGAVLMILGFIFALWQRRTRYSNNSE